MGCDAMEDTNILWYLAASIFRMKWDLWNVGILPQHYAASQPRRPQLESSPPWKPQIYHVTDCCYLSADSLYTKLFEYNLNLSHRHHFFRGWPTNNTLYQMYGNVH